MMEILFPAARLRKLQRELEWTRLGLLVREEWLVWRKSMLRLCLGLWKQRGTLKEDMFAAHAKEHAELK
jgi:hypothetical protein